MEPHLRRGLPLSHRPARIPGHLRPRGDRRRAARPPRRLPAHLAPERRRQGDGLRRRVLLQRRALAPPAADGDGGLRPRAHQVLLPGTGEGDAALQRPLAARGGGGRADRSAGRSHALHGGRYRRARLRRRHQHARVGRGSDPAPPGQGAAGPLQAPDVAVALLEIPQAARRPGARAASGGAAQRGRRLHRRSARAWMPIRACARAPPT